MELMNTNTAEPRFYANPITTVLIGLIALIEILFDSGILYLFWNRFLTIGFTDLPHFKYEFIVCFGMLAAGWGFIKLLLRDVLNMASLMIRQPKGEDDE